MAPPWTFAWLFLKITPLGSSSSSSRRRRRGWEGMEGVVVIVEASVSIYHNYYHHLT